MEFYVVPLRCVSTLRRQANHGVGTHEVNVVVVDGGGSVALGHATPNAATKRTEVLRDIDAGWGVFLGELATRTLRAKWLEP